MADRQIQVTAGEVTVTATLNDSPTSDRFWDSLPIEGRVQTWGDEIYFSTPVEIPEDPEWSEETVELGAVAYWPSGNALCLFFGPTPMSVGEEIRPASAVNVMGMIDGDPTILKRVSSGTGVVVEEAS